MEEKFHRREVIERGDEHVRETDEETRGNYKADKIKRAEKVDQIIRGRKRNGRGGREEEEDDGEVSKREEAKEGSFERTFV